MIFEKTDIEVAPGSVGLSQHLTTLSRPISVTIPGTLTPVLPLLLHSKRLNISVKFEKFELLATTGKRTGGRGGGKPIIQ